jgi:acetyl esterase/lipase
LLQLASVPFDKQDETLMHEAGSCANCPKQTGFNKLLFADVVKDSCTDPAYAPMDAADKVSCRPDFGVAIYPGHMLENTTKEFELNPEIPVTDRTPPTFLLQAEDDNVDGVNQSLVYYIALKNAWVPVEMHLYARGGYAFGLQRTQFPITDWPQLVEAWLGTIGMISE